MVSHFVIGLRKDFEIDNRHKDISEKLFIIERNSTLELMTLYVAHSNCVIGFI